MHFVKAKALLTKENGMNVYRGCAHGCIYCDSRSDCYHFDHPFEDIEVKENAPELLEKILRTKRKRVMIGTGSMADPYQPCEKKLMLTRRCLELINGYEFGATVITKSDLVMRDIDLFKRINDKAKAVLQMTLTVADEELSRLLEPNVCTSKRRYEVIKEFRERNIPCVVWLSPILPFLSDSEENIRTILDWCVDAGVKGIVCFGMGMTLRNGSREYYYRCLDRIDPGLSKKYQRKYGDAYVVPSDNNDRLMQIFHETCAAHNIIDEPEACFRYLRELPEKYTQPSFF